MVNCGIEKMIYELPESRKTTEQIVAEAGYGTEVADNIKHAGVYSIAMDNETLLTKYIHKVFLRMKEEIPNLEQRTKLIIFVHSIPFLAPKNVEFWKLCLEEENMFKHAPYFWLSGQPCAIFHMGIQVAESFLATLQGGEGILLIGADKVYCSDDRIFFNTLLGDSVLAAFISRNTEHNKILKSYSESYVVGYAGENTPEDVTREFRKVNFINIRNAIETCVANAGIKMEEVTYIVPHSCNKQMWDNVSTITKFPRKRILDCYLSQTGHLNSNDSFIHYCRAIHEGIIKKNDICILVNPGFGGTRGCTLLQY